ncbi:hypothetical protein PT2222_240066 [Paraburkholderia tropica]
MSELRVAHAGRVAAFQPDQREVRNRRDREIDERGDQQEEEQVEGAAARVLGGLHDIGETDDRHQRRRFHEHLPVVADARQREAHHLRKQDAGEHARAAHAVGVARFELAARHGEKRAAKGLGEIRAVNEAEREHARHERIDVDLRHAERVGGLVHADLDAVEQQQHQHEIGHRTDQRGVGRRASRERPVERELGRRAREAEQHGHAQRQQREFDRLDRAGEQHRTKAVKHHARLRGSRGRDAGREKAREVARIVAAPNCLLKRARLACCIATIRVGADRRARRDGVSPALSGRDAFGSCKDNAPPGASPRGVLTSFGSLFR